MNLLELLVPEMSIYMTIQHLGQGSHILDFTDSSNDLGWMNKSSFDLVKEEPHDTVTWWLGWTLVINEVSLYSQQIKVTKNIIAGSLSGDIHLSDKYLTTIFKSILPPQK